MNELVSVIIPYRDDRGWLEDAIQSVREQTYPHWQLVLVKGDRSCAENMNVGLEMSKGKYIKKLDEDDLLLPNCLEDSVRAIRGHHWLYANAINWDMQENTRISYGYGPTTLKEMLEKNRIHGGTTFYRKDVLVAVGGYDERLLTGEEYDINLSLMACGFDGVYLDKDVYVYRIHGRNKSIVRDMCGIQRSELIQQIKDKYV